ARLVRGFLVFVGDPPGFASFMSPGCRLSASFLFPPKDKTMKPKQIDGVEVWKDFEDLAARLGLNVIERAVYSYLLLHTRLEGKPRLHFTLPELARNVRISRGPVRDALRRLADHGALRFVE